MSDPFLGELRAVGFNFAPRGWALCDGQILSIAQNSALFSLLGTQYGGDGRSTFALPNLQGRVPIHQGNLAGGDTYVIGEVAGTENTTLLASQLPAHTHPISGTSGLGTTDQPGGSIVAAGGSYADPGSANADLAPTRANTGGNPFSILQPYLVINWIIALQGIFPSRS
jgi:microcystin-dependent protein